MIELYSMSREAHIKVQKRLCKLEIGSPFAKS